MKKFEVKNHEPGLLWDETANPLMKRLTLSATHF